MKDEFRANPHGFIFYHSHLTFVVAFLFKKIRVYRRTHLKLKVMIRLLAFTLAAVFVASALSGCGGETAEKKVTIGISQVVTHPSLDATRQGIIDALADKGYIDNENLVIDYQNSEGDPSLFASIAQQFVTKNVDAIVSIATPNSQAAVAAAKGTAIPVIFTAVTDPVGSGLISDWDSHSEENVTGVSDMIVVEDGIELIQEIIPGVKTIGTLYNSGESNSVFLVAELKKACQASGITVREATVSTSAEIATAAQSLVGNVDAVWIGTDNTVVSGLEALIGVCEEQDIPLFSADEDSITRGCIAAYSFDYYDIGYQTGEMVARILDGENAATIPVEKGKVIALSINLGAAERMGVTISQDIIDRAETVHD